MEMSTKELKYIRIALDLEWDRRLNIYEKSKKRYEQGKTDGFRAIDTKRKADDVYNLIEKVEAEIRRLESEK